MKIFSSYQIKACDQFTIDNEFVSSLHLMEKAAQSCMDFIVHEFNKNETIYIFCGVGNNGGDGFALARLLYLKGFDVEVFIDKTQKKFSKDAQVNFANLKEVLGVSVSDFSDFKKETVSKASLIIDALFGLGLNRKIEGKSAEIIKLLNSIEAQKISIDLPSGIIADENLPDDAMVFQADITLSFQFYKKAFLHPETGKFCGRVEVLDIGLSKECIENTTVNNYVISDSCIFRIYQPREEFSHKGNFGKSCIVAGSFGKIGAAVLATKASTRSGSGLTFILAPKCGYDVLQTAVPEAIFLNGGIDFIQYFDLEEEYTYGIGPGLGNYSETKKSFLEFLKNYKNPLVLDADALNILSENSQNLKLIPKKSIITPHPKEFSRLFGETQNSFERVELAKQKAHELDIYIVLKDHHTQVITPQMEVFYNVTGNCGLAKGASGDVLLGIVTSLLAQKYSPKEAAIFGVWLHGKAADIAAEKHSKESLLATDVIVDLGEVFKFLENKKGKL